MKTVINVKKKKKKNTNVKRITVIVFDSTRRLRDFLVKRVSVLSIFIATAYYIL